MNKKITQFKWLAATLMLVAAMVMPSVAWAYNQPQGEGTKESPYKISSGDELYWFAAHVNDDPDNSNGICAVLTTNISVSGEWVPIMGFNGTFDGQGHTISGLQKTNNGYGVDIGLFAGIESNAEIRNVGIVNCNFIGNSGCQVGGVCGINGGGTITNCYNTGSVNGEEGLVGGICGSNEGTIKNCYNIGSVKNGQGLGGICGLNNNGTITNCYYLSGKATGGIYNNWGTGSAEVKTAEQFRSGEVAWQLNGGTTDGSQAWYQTLSSSGEGYPNLNKDTENRTVYGAYKHEETSPTCSNSKSDLAMLHAHAYDSNATEEASGNHDMTCEQNENNPYTWTDNEDYSNATAKCNFFCSVCQSEVAKDMTVTPDEGKTNVSAKCLDKGYNYYVASLTFNNTPYTNYYTQEVPALGHDDSGDVTFNSGESIYEKHCNRDGCNEHLRYYATSDGSVVANKDSEGVFTADELTLQDATTYDNKAVFTATNFTYTRTFTSTEWTTWYVPFDLTLTQEICAHYDFSRINNVHQYDTDNDGTADKTVVESFRQMPGVTLKANYPYLVKPVSEGDLNMMLPLEGVQPALAQTNSIDCQSVDFSYTFTGTYTAMGEGGSDYYDPYTLWTDGTWQHFRSLDPMRHYLTVTPRNSSYASAASLRSIMLSVIGDEGTTGIVNMYSDERKAAETYDLGGRRLPAGASQRGVVIENGKVIIKK